MTAAGRPGRLIIIGWDGADWAVIEEGWRRGRLPVLRSLADDGQKGVLASTIPPLTPTAWTSFFTGSEPGEHGIFEFVSRSPDDYRVRLVPGAARRVPTLMRRLDAAGYRTVQVTVPWTYPAEELQHGAIVPGFDAPDESFESSHPRELREALARAVPRVPRSTDIRSAGPGIVLREQQESIRLREEIAKFLWGRLDPDVFMIVFSETDHAAHRLWRSGPVPAELVDAYEQVDEATGRLLREFANPADTVLVVSDHGSKPIHTWIHLAPILVTGGWLKLSGDGRAKKKKKATALSLIFRAWQYVPPAARYRISRTLPSRFRSRLSRALPTPRIDWSRTSAFPSGTTFASGVNVHASPPYRLGWVSEGAYEEIREDVRARLSSVVDPVDGRSVFRLVAPREEVYTGPAASLAPDLVLVGSDGYGVRAGLRGRQETLSRTEFGGHREEGVYVSSRALGLSTPERIGSILPKVLEAVGFEASAELGSEVEGTAPSGSMMGSEPFTPEEAEEVEARLRDLGYLE